MSEPKLISPMLDGFVMGKPMSNHDGIQCCPAMKENSDHKYIVKVISIPASQTQLDAFLLTGAYKDPAAALDYFKTLSDDVVAEAEILQKLSKLEGFLPYESWQIEPMDSNRLGYNVYLLGSYKRSLERFMRRNPVTHLGAVNLGLDLCAALSTCRNAGYLFVDLKPSNIFISDEKEYRIGDLGFVSLDSLKFTSLPSKYRSAYTAPEMSDVLATLNETLDTYAVGMILYQIYNNGILPTEPNTEENPLSAPLNADYEIAEIIMKACAPDPRDRWDSPKSMGQALAAYMQRNTVNDTPICPPLADVSAEETPQESQADQEAPAQEQDHEELAFMQSMVNDETAPEEADAEELAEHALTKEVSAILDQAEDIITHHVPAPVSSETINISMVQDAAQAEQTEAASAEETRVLPDLDKTQVVSPAAVKKARRRLQIFDDEEDYDDDDDDYEEETSDEEVGETAEKPRKKFNPLILLLVVLLIGALSVGGYYFYRNYYLLNIDGLKVDGSNNQITVVVDTDIDDAKLTVICSDTYGNTKRMTLKDGQAVFSELTPDTLYKIQLEISGFHKLTGPSYSSYTTAAETKISELTAMTGTEDGSVILEFKVEGPEKSPDWQVIYSTEGEDAQTFPFTGHRANITGLTVGKTYTFELIPATELYMVGESKIQFTASKIILAENLEITAYADTTLSAQWTLPADTTVSGWDVVCYSADGSRYTATTTEPAVTFTDIQSGKAYTLEVKAAGMSQSVTANVSANPITVTGITVDDTTAEVLNVTWEFQGNAPEGGWNLMYTLDNSTEQKVVRCDTNSGQINLRIPGATYHMQVLAADGTTVFCEDFAYTCPDAAKFNKHDLPASKIEANLLKTPSKSGWSYKNVSRKDYTTTFKSGQKVSMLLRGTVDFWLPREDTNLLCFIRDAEGNVLTQTIYTNTDTWYNMWNNANYHYFELDLVNTPTEPGEYTVYVFFNGCSVTAKKFTITE